MRRIIQEKWAIGETFALEEIYVFETHFSDLYPANKTPREKLRQTLQYLRDNGFVEFVDNQGNYRRVK